MSPVSVDALKKAIANQFQENEFKEIIYSWTTRKKAIESLNNLPKNLNGTTIALLQMTFNQARWDGEAE